MSEKAKDTSPSLSSTPRRSTRGRPDGVVTDKGETVSEVGVAKRKGEEREGVEPQCEKKVKENVKESETKSTSVSLSPSPSPSPSLSSSSTAMDIEKTGEKEKEAEEEEESKEASSLSSTTAISPTLSTSNLVPSTISEDNTISLGPLRCHYMNELRSNLPHLLLLRDLVFDSPVSSFCCLRCLLRFAGPTDFHVFQASDEDIYHDISLLLSERLGKKALPDIERGLKEAQNSLCKVCLGALQHAMEEENLSFVLNQIKQSDYQFDTFRLSVTSCASTLIREWTVVKLIQTHW